VPDLPGLRPTPDRVRETLFNWLGQDLNGWRVLDAFAGSGALGFEAASRGAAAVLLLEQDGPGGQPASQRAAPGHGELRVERTDALRWMAAAAPARFDLVLVDPPFDAGLAEPAAALAAPLVVPGGFMYLESAQPLSQAPAGFELHRSLKAGAVHAQLWRWARRNARRAA
jgi:16S rRNA (guanine966-N2)-methyltransferase